MSKFGRERVFIDYNNVASSWPDIRIIISWDIFLLSSEVPCVVLVVEKNISTGSLLVGNFF